MKKWITVLAFTLLVPLVHPRAALSQEDPAHNELRALRDGLLDAIKKGDVERELTFLHPNVVVTWQNAEVSRGRDGVRAYLNRMLNGPSKIVSDYKFDVSVDELTILYGGDTGISFGGSKEHLGLATGTSIDYPARWSATLVKEDGKWLIANLHASSNLFENPFLAATKQLMYIGCAVALLVGLVLGWLVGRRRKAAA
jgi:ketosteroid isomerase-like protein